MFTLNFLKWDNYDGFLLPACVKLVIILFFLQKMLLKIYVHIKKVYYHLLMLNAYFQTVINDMCYSDTCTALNNIYQQYSKRNLKEINHIFGLYYQIKLVSCRLKDIVDQSSLKSFGFLL